MELVDKVVHALRCSKGFVAHDDAGESVRRVPAPEFTHEFLGVREYWGSQMSVAVVRGDKVDHDDVPGQAEDFYRFGNALLPLSGNLQVRYGGLNAGRVKLGSFGLMIYVFEHGCGSRTADKIRSCRHGSMKEKDYVRCWVLDGYCRRVITHRGVPFGMFPGKRFLRSLLI